MAGASAEARAPARRAATGGGATARPTTTILAFIGGFAFGDHLGAGFVFANKIRWRLYDQLLEFIERGRPGPGDLQRLPDHGPAGPAARPRRRLPHAAGDAGAQRPAGLPRRLGPAELRPRLALRLDARPRADGSAGASRRGQVPGREPRAAGAAGGQAARSWPATSTPTASPTEEWPHNPNGSPRAVAGICDPSGRLFGLMPHPDAYLYPFHHPQWQRRRLERHPARTRARAWPSSATAWTPPLLVCSRSR